jgi:hypothetical protein
MKYTASLLQHVWSACKIFREIHRVGCIDLRSNTSRNNTGKIEWTFDFAVGIRAQNANIVNYTLD